MSIDGVASIGAAAASLLFCAGRREKNSEQQQEQSADCFLVAAGVGACCRRTQGRCKDPVLLTPRARHISWGGQGRCKMAKAMRRREGCIALSPFQIAEDKKQDLERLRMVAPRFCLFVGSLG